MGCNCKVSGGGSQIQDKLEPKSGVQMLLKYTAKILGFLIGVLLLPLMVIGIIWFMFDIIVLNKDVDLSIFLKKVVKINKALMEDDEDDEDEEDDYDEEIDYESDEYITENVEEIK
jgi:hypothetical protein